VANRRHRRALGCAAADRIDADQAAMLPLPPGRPGDRVAGIVAAARDHYVRLDANDYSVDPSVTGRRVEVVADLERVRVWCEGRLVADHASCWARHQTLSDPAHLQAAARLRHQRTAQPRATTDEVEVRCLADYDQAFGLDEDAGVA
jgi:Mu transposase, C-terminal domain